MNKLFLLFFLMLSYIGYAKTLEIKDEPIYETKNYMD